MSDMAAIPSASALAARTPSARTPSGRHAEALAREKRVHEIRIQAAVVRSLLDELELLIPAGASPESLQGQMLEELARLGCSMAETAAEFASGDDGSPIGAASETRLRLRKR